MHTRSFYTIEEVDYDALIYCYYLNGYRCTHPPTLSHTRTRVHVIRDTNTINLLYTATTRRILYTCSCNIVPLFLLSTTTTALHLGIGGTDW
jgi:hypothetical protein